jgi:hypothetical protein
MASWMSLDQSLELYSGPPRNVAFIDNLAFDPKLQPREYQIAETSPSSKILIHDVNIFDTTGREPYRGDVLIIGKIPSYKSPSRVTIYTPSRRKICQSWNCRQER